MSENTWDAGAIPSQTGKVIVITGATSGIGYEAALVLARAGAAAVLASRNETKGNMTLERIRLEYSSAKVSFMPLDTGSQLIT